MDEQSWIDAAYHLACDFVQDDDQLGYFMLEHSAHYWNACFDDGLTPQQALDGLVALLQFTNLLASYKAARPGLWND